MSVDRAFRNKVPGVANSGNIAVAFATNWTDLGGGNRACGYRKDAAGLVSLRGVIMASAAQLANATMFTLPTGFRPLAGQEQFFSGSSVGTVQVTVSTSGVVSCSAAIPLNNWVTLCGLTYFND